MNTVKRLPPIRLAKRAAPMPTRAQDEAWRKICRIMEVLEPINPNLHERYNLDHSICRIVDTKAGPVTGKLITWGTGGTPPWREATGAVHEGVIIAEAKADWKLGAGAGLHAWEAAYKKLML